MPDSDGDDAIANLAPAIVETFGAIILGYCMGRAGIITDDMIGGISKFTATIALPALLFQAMATISLATIEVDFVLAVLISKSILFFGTLVVTLLTDRRSPAKFSQAGIRAIFASQSNDLAFGLPVIQSLFGASHPNYASNIFVVAPISLVLLNPIGYCLMEYGKHYGRDRTNETEADRNAFNWKLIVRKNILGVLANPIVFMTIFGIFGNLAFSHNLPPVINSLLTELANAFAALALFSLGFSMVGKFSNFPRSKLLLIVILVLLQGLLMPILTRQFVTLLSTNPTTHSGTVNSTVVSANQTSGNDALADFAFVYGTLPTAPTLIVFSRDLGGPLTSPAAIAFGIVLSTSLACPILFLSASLLSSPSTHSTYTALVDGTLTIGYTSLFFTLVLLVLLICSRRIGRPLFHPLFCLVLAQFGLSLASSFCQAFSSHPITFAVNFFFAQSVFAWSAALAVNMAIMAHSGIRACKRALKVYHLFCWGVPLIATVTLTQSAPFDHTPNLWCWYRYGTSKSIASLVLSVIYFATTCGALVGVFRAVHHHHEQHMREFQMGDREAPLLADQEESLYGDEEEKESGESLLSRQELTFEEATTPVGAPPPQTQTQTQTQLQSQQPQPQVYNMDPKDDHAILMHNRWNMRLRMVAVAVYTMIVTALAFFDQVWTLSRPDLSAVQVEVAFFHYALLYACGIVSFFVFGLDQHLTEFPYKFLRSLSARIRHKIFDTEVVEMPGVGWDVAVLNDITRDCRQFIPFYSECTSTLCRNRRFNRYKQVLTGHELVNWLIFKELAKTRAQAVEFGRNLVRGGLLHHVRCEHHFHDSSFFYRFSPLPNQLETALSSYDFSALIPETPAHETSVQSRLRASFRASSVMAAKLPEDNGLSVAL